MDDLIIMIIIYVVNGSELKIFFAQTRFVNTKLKIMYAIHLKLI